MVSGVKVEPILRILDANANRAREGIRTAEDYLRFTIGDAQWAGRLRRVRHRISETLAACLSGPALIEARRVLTDSGHPARGAAEAPAPRNEEPRQVALRGLKRAQEALRVLEEYLQGPAPAGARQLAEARYELYEAEQWLVCGGESARRLVTAFLYVLLCEAQCRLGLEATARAALKGGADMIQLREKQLEGAALVERARRLREVCGEYGALLIVNDRADVALAAQAAGVHLGQADLSPADVRRWSGAGLLIGRSTHSLQEARRAVEEEEAAYLAVGAMYATATREQAVVVGPELARQVLAQGWQVPAFAIGGITPERARELRRYGVRRVAVSSAVAAAPDPERAAREFCEVLKA